MDKLNIINGCLHVKEEIFVIGSLGPYSVNKSPLLTYVDVYSKRKSLLKPGIYKLINKGSTNYTFEDKYGKNCIPVNNKIKDDYDYNPVCNIFFINKKYIN